MIPTYRSRLGAPRTHRTSGAPHARRTPQPPRGTPHGPTGMLARRAAHRTRGLLRALTRGRADQDPDPLGVWPASVLCKQAPAA
jgi:hypothetical protein